MEIKKSPKADLERGKTLSIMMGVVVALAIVFVSFEWGTRDINLITDSGIKVIIDDEPIDITMPEDTPPPPPPPPPPAVAEILEVVDDKTEVDSPDVMSTEDNLSSAQPESYIPMAAIEEEEESSNQIFTIVQEMPEFPGGDGELMKWISKAIKYPVIAQENGIQGRVVCSFTIEKDGSIVDAEVLRGRDPSLDKEALRVISTMPKWKPGSNRGKPVRVRYTLPIVFRLQ